MHDAKNVHQNSAGWGGNAYEEQPANMQLKLQHRNQPMQSRSGRAHLTTQSGKDSL